MCLLNPLTTYTFPLKVAWSGMSLIERGVWPYYMGQTRLCTPSTGGGCGGSWLPGARPLMGSNACQVELLGRDGFISICRKVCSQGHFLINIIATILIIPHDALY